MYLKLPFFSICHLYHFRISLILFLISLLRLSGKIPEWLEGSLIRNGTGIFEIGETKMNHLFDGLSVINRFVIDGHGEGKATYQNCILKSDTYKDSKAANRLTMHQFGKIELLLFFTHQTVLVIHWFIST